MKQKTEINIILYLAAVFLLSSGLMTKFQIHESIDIQLHDTYYVIYNSQFILMLVGFLVLIYLLTLTTKRLAKNKRGLKIIMTLMNRFFTLLSATLLITSTVAFVKATHSLWDTELLGVLTVMLGTAILFVLRTIEVSRVKQKTL